MPVLMIKRQALPRKPASLRLNSMSIVVTQNPLATRRVQGERVPDSMRNILGRLNLPCLDLDPVAVLLINDLIVEVKQGADLVIFHESEYITG